MSTLSPLEILHEAFVATLSYRGDYAFVPQLLRDAERYLRGERVVADVHAAYFYADEPIHHTCADYPTAECPACIAWSEPVSRSWFLSLVGWWLFPEGEYRWTRRR